MATSFTYTTLKSALQSMLEENGTEYIAFLDQIIALGEDKVLRDLDLELFDETAATTFSAGSPWLAKPSDLVSARTMHYTTGAGAMVLMEPRSWELAKDYWPTVASTTSTPKYYTEYSATNWFIAGTPASGLTVTIRYNKRPAGLSGSVATTWLSQHAGDVLFYACLVVSEQYLKADARVALWKQDYAERLAAAIYELKPSQRDEYMPLTQIPTKE